MKQMTMNGDNNYWDHWMRRRMSRRAMLRRAGLAGLVLAGGSSLWACGQSETSKPASGSTPAATDRPKSGGTIKIGTNINWNILDPHTFYYGGDEVYLKHLFDNVVNYDDKLAYVPALSIAESWENVDDTTILFKLRKGIKFTDGTDWDANALKFNFDRIADPQIKSPRGYALALAKSIDYPDNYTCKIVLKQPMASFFGEIAHPGMGMESPANAAKYKNIADLQRNPVGSGPFILTESVPDDHFTLIRNKEYWRKDANGSQTPYVDELRFQVIPDETVRLGSLTTGQIDMDINTVPKDVAAIKANSNLDVQIQDGISMSGMYWNLSRPPFDNVNFRKAVTHGLNREAITKAYTFGISKAYTGVVMPSAAWAYDSKRPVIPYDPVKAKQYLDQALAQGVKPEFLCYVMNVSNNSIVEMMQADLAKLGIKVSMKPDNTAANRYWTTFEIDCFYAGYSMAADPYSKIFTAHHSQGFYTPEKKNLGQSWDTPSGFYAKIDKAIDASNKTYDPKERAKYLNQASDILDDEVAFVGIFYTSYVAAYNKKVQALGSGGDGRVRFWNTWLKG